MDRRQCIALAGSLALSRMAGATESPYDAALAAYPGFNGVVLAGRGAAILYSKAVGLAEPLAATAMTLHTRLKPVPSPNGLPPWWR